MKNATQYFANFRVCKKSFLMSILLMVLFGNWAFAVDSTEIETAMRKYQSIYHYVGVVEGSGNKYVSWPGVNCLYNAPSYPENFYGNITEAKATELVNNLVSQFYGGGIYWHFIEDVTDQNEITHVQVTEPNSTDSWQDKLVQVNGDIDKLVLYDAGWLEDVNHINKIGYSSDYAEIEGTDCDQHRTENGSFEDAESEAKSNWNESEDDACGQIGVATWSVHEHYFTEYCNGTKSMTCDNYFAYVKSINVKFQKNLTKHTGNAYCYLRLTLWNGNGGYYCYYDYGTDGTAPYNPVDVDEKYHLWESPPTGEFWKSDYLFSTEVPDINAPSRETWRWSNGSYGEATELAWGVVDSIIVVEPEFQTESDTFIPCPAPSVVVYKDKDENTVYSAGQGCGYGNGEVVSGRIVINSYVEGMQLEARLGEFVSPQIARLNIGGYDITDCNIHCTTPQQDAETGVWYVPFKVSAYVGEGKVCFSLASVYTKILGEDANDPNEYYRAKYYRGNSSASFNIKTNGYECCNRKSTTSHGISIPKISKHGNGDIEVYFPDIGESYIWGGSSEGFPFFSYSKVCAFIDENISDYAAGEIDFSSLGGKNLIYIVGSNWSTSGVGEAATFDREVDSVGNTINYASYDSGDRLVSITEAVSSNIYRQYYYGDSSHPDRITSYTEFAGNLSRTYTIIYDATGRASGTIGGSGSGCSSCCSSGDNRLYTYNEDGYILTESDIQENVIYEYEYDSKNRVIAKWLGQKTNNNPVQIIIYDTNSAGSYGGAEIQDVYDYVNGSDYQYTLNVLNSASQVITQIKYDQLNIDVNSIPTDPNAIIGSGGLITTFDYEYSGDSLSAIITKSPQFNAGVINTYQKSTFNNSASNEAKEILVIVDANDNPSETTLSRRLFTNDNFIANEFDWYGIQKSVYTDYSYDSDYRLQSRRGAWALQLNDDNTQLLHEYTYHPDGRLNTETLSNGGSGKVITISIYDDINQPAGTTVTDTYNNILYETYSKSNGLGDVIYNVSNTGVATGKQYDSGGKVISEFTFANPNDVNLFANASYSDISGVYEDVNVISQTNYAYDVQGKIVYIYTAINDGEFDYNSPEDWSITAFGYDAYGRKNQEVQDYGNLNLTTTYQYDNQGQIVKTTYPDEHWVRQIYNGRGLVTMTIEGYGSESTSPNDFVVSETIYDGDGKALKNIKGGVVTASYEYDEAGYVYRQYEGDFENQYCNFIQYERNYAGDVESQKFVNVSSTGIATVMQQIDWRYNGRGEKVEQRILTNPNTDPCGVSNIDDFTDKVSLYSYDHFEHLTETVTKTDDANGIYTNEYKEYVNYQDGDHIEQNWYDITGRLVYEIKFDCQSYCYYDPFFGEYCYTTMPFESMDDVFSYAKDKRDIYIAGYNYQNEQLANKEVLVDYNEAHPDFYDYQYSQNFDAGLDWKTVDAFEYDKAGRKVKAIDAADNYTTMEYDSRNLPISNALWQGQFPLRFKDGEEFDPNFVPYMVRRTMTAYNTNGLVTRTAILVGPNDITDIDDVNLVTDKVVDYVYDANNGRLYRQKEVFGKAETGDDRFVLTEYSYDSLGRVENVLSGELVDIYLFGQFFSEEKTPLKYIGYTYNQLGQKTVQTVTEVNTIDYTNADFSTYYTYDSQDRITEIENAQGSIAQYFYDSLGRKFKEIDSAGMVTLYNYDTLGYLDSVVEDANNSQRTTSYGYDRKGRKTSVISGGDSTLYSYNYLDKITAIDYPDDRQISYGCDMEGNITSRTVTKNSQSVVTNYSRNALGRIGCKQYSNDPNWEDPNTDWPFDEILYDAAGNKFLVAYVNGNNDVDSGAYDYDGMGNLRNSSDGHGNWGYSVSYGYDSRGFLTSMTYPDGNSVTYGRDALGRVVDVNYEGSIIASYYWLGDTVIAKTLGDIEYSARVDSLGRIASEGYGGVSYTYDYHNHTNRLTDRNSADYGYDTLGRVTSEESTSYTCDILGNPTNASNDGLTYTADNEDRVTQVADGSTTIAHYSYDQLGRRTSKTIGDETTYFAYDKFGNVIAEYVQDGNNVVWQRNYIYGGSGELVYVKAPKIENVIENEDLDNLLAFLDAWLCNPNCTQDNLYWDYNSDSQINFIDWAANCDSFENAFQQSNPTNNHILADFKGSVIGMTDSNGVFIEIGYNAWGTPSYTGNLEGLNILWNGYYLDSETGNYYLRNRYYSPLERKFVTEDPRGINPDENWENYFGVMSQYDDGYGLQVYCKGDPVNSWDDWGLYDLGTACDKYTCKDGLRIMGKPYNDAAKKKCHREAKILSNKFHDGMIHYWRFVAPNYTMCHKYARYIMYSMRPANGLEFFSLRGGGRAGYFQHWWIGVFHKLNRVEYSRTHAQRVGDVSDGVLDPWSIGSIPYI